MTGSSVGRTSQLRGMETGLSKQELKITNVHNRDGQKSISERTALSILVAVRIHQQTTTSGCTRQPRTETVKNFIIIHFIYIVCF